MKKNAALVFLLIDHIGLYYADYLPGELCFVMRLIGNLALPIFAYYLAIGFLRSENIAAYFLRIFCVFVLSETLILVFLHFTGQAWNTYPVADILSILLGFPVLYGIELLLAAMPGDRIASLRLIEATADTHSDRFDVRIGDHRDGKTRLPGIIIPPFPAVMLFFIAIPLIFGGILLSLAVPTDHSFFTVMSITAFYLAARLTSRRKKEFLVTFFLLLCLIDFLVSLYCKKEISTAFLGLLSVLLCLFSNPDRPVKRAVRVIFYLWYPLHIALLLLLHLFAS